MKKLFSFIFVTACLLFVTQTSHGEKNSPDTVTTGIYITSIHNIDFKQKEYAVSLWIWFKYRNKEFEFDKNIEIPQAKTVTKSFTSTDTTKDGRIYMLMKLDCVMKDSWKINKFPFDYQNLRLTIENSQFDTTDLVFKVDTLGARYGAFTLSGWNIEKDSFNISVRNQVYNTAFGDESYAKPYSSYSAFRVKVGIERQAKWTLFWKIFIGMYIAFLIGYVCVFIHAGSVESRFALNVGALFAAVGNKYIIDSSLPDSSTFTLVDTLHGITLFYIAIVIACTIYSLKMVKEDHPDKAHHFDRIAARVLITTYLVLNIFFIVQASM